MQEPLTLSDAERRMILTLRNMPDSPLRDRVLRLVEDVLAFARNPRCHEMQADGVPCERPEADCDQCQVVTALLATLEGRVPRG
ncbi:hypothetical protein [Mesoterricola sediminis]|uniref:Uncharacterized protein n=1 Tax=Mesoterricola sediminis TaxID=2927980 RepID=A0AA48HGL0_9BACT|nr:hypothetical protein [Mesoterricola sediminis]BDU77838.1 hypothetical protein METESE_27960 [Mesoterricola sediminis]